MAKKSTITLERALRNLARTLPSRSKSSTMSYNGPRWTPKPGVDYILPGISYSPRGSGASSTSGLEALKAQQQALLEKGSLGNQRHPDHVNDVYEYRRVTQLILAAEAPQKPEPERTANISREVAEIDRMRSPDRERAASEEFGKMMADKDDPVHHPASPLNSVRVADLQRVSEIMNTEKS